ncbi:MAG: LytTR family transcriptional regulator DNA-binding domain-containing protein [Candidatus Cryptobacteroides sp.]
MSYKVKHIVISRGTELLRVPADRLMYISSDGNYSNVTTSDGKTRLVSMQLGQIEDLIAGQIGDTSGTFLRLGRSLIINIDYIYLIDTSRQQLILSDCAGSSHELTASREVLIKLKAYIESLLRIEPDENR